MLRISIIAFLFFIAPFMGMARELPGATPVPSRHHDDPSWKLTLSGTVTDARSGEPLSGASVYLADDRIGAIADDKGHYVLQNIPAGHHVIEVSHAGYSTLVEHIELQGDTKKDFALTPVIVENQAVIVTGVAGATSIRKTPVPVTALRKTDLLQTPSFNIIDALTRIPGVSQVSSGPAIAKPVIRGLGYNRVVTINEGVRQEGQQWGDEHGIEIDELSVARAEVVKGPASLMYGSDAIAGVINLVTNTPVAEGTLKGNVISQYQSTNGLIALHASLAGNQKGFNWNLYGTGKSAGDYRNAYDGRVLNSRFREMNYGGYAGWNKSWGYSHLIISSFNQRPGMIEGERDSLTGNFLLFGGTPLERIATKSDLRERDDLVPNQHIRHNKLVSDNNIVLGKSRLKFNLAWQQNRRQEFGNPEDPDEKELWFDLNTLNYTVQWQLPKIREWHTTIGLNGMRQSNLNKGEEVLIPEYRLFDAGAYVYTQRFFKKATFSGGLRIDNRTVHGDAYEEGGQPKFTDFRRSFSTVSGSLGFSYEPNAQWTLKTNLARGFRAPTLAELASNGTHEGTNRYEYGDQNLSPEKSLQFDAGVEWNQEHFSLNLTAFHNRVNDFIFYSRLKAANGGDSLVLSDGEYIDAFRFGQQDASLSGFEVMLDIHPHPFDWLHIENAFSLVRGRFDQRIEANRSGSDNLPLVPAPRWNSQLRVDIQKAGPRLRQCYLRLEMDRNFRQQHYFTGFDTETFTPAYTLFNLGMGGNIIRKEKTLFSLHLALLNIGDVAYQNHLSRLKYTATNFATGRAGVFNPGRNFTVKLQVPLEFK